MSVFQILASARARGVRPPAAPTSPAVIRSGLRWISGGWVLLGGLMVVAAVAGEAPEWSAIVPVTAAAGTWVVARPGRVRPAWLVGGWAAALLTQALIVDGVARMVLIAALALVLVISLPFSRPRSPGLVMAGVLAGLTGIWLVLGPRSPWWIAAMWVVSIGISGIGAVMLARQTEVRLDALRSVADAFSVGFFRFTASGELLDRNHVFSEWTSGSNSVASITDDVLELLTAAAASAQEQSAEFTITLRDRGGRRVEGLVRPVAGVNGIRPGLVYEAIALDVSDRLHRSEAERMGEDIFMRAFTAAPIGMVLLAEGGTLLEANEAFRAMVGHNDRRPRNFLEYLSLEDRPHCAQLLAETPNGHGALRQEVRYLASGESRAAILSCARLPGLWGDPPPRFIVQLVDVEDRERAVRALEELVRDKDEFVSRISHHLRTPLTAVFGFAEELLERGHQFTADERAEALEYIRLESDRAASVVANLSVAARVDMARLDVRLQPVDVLQIAREEGERVARINNVAVDVQDGEFWVVADRGRLHHVMRNLISNAAEHADHMIEVACAVEGRAARVVIVDDGPGVAPEVLDHMFEPYWGDDQQRAPGPIGLGLPVARTLAEAMDGRIDYHRDEGFSVFILRLPIAEGAALGVERRDVS